MDAGRTRAKHSCRHVPSPIWRHGRRQISRGITRHPETHQNVGKETGETAHVERWNNTLCQRLARYVRKTLSFSKKICWHHMITKFFVYNYNLVTAVAI